jgi:hypothetical protein
MLPPLLWTVSSASGLTTLASPKAVLTNAVIAAAASVSRKRRLDMIGTTRSIRSDLNG